MVSRFPDSPDSPQKPPLLIHCGRGFARITFVFSLEDIVFFGVTVPTKIYRMELITGFTAVIVQLAQWAADTVNDLVGELSTL